MCLQLAVPGGTLGDSPEKFLAVVTNLVHYLREVGLELNSRKCKLTIINHTEEELQPWTTSYKPRTITKVEINHYAQNRTATSPTLRVPPPTTTTYISTSFFAL